LLREAAEVEPDYPMAHSALAEAWGNLGYDDRAKDEAKRAFDLSGSLSRENRLAVEARYRAISHQWDRAVELYRTLFRLFPDNLEYGLQMADAERRAGKSGDALVTVETLRHLPPPAKDDPRIDLAEANAAHSLGDLKREQAAATRAVQGANAGGEPLLVAAAQLELCWALERRGQQKEAQAACESAKASYAQVGDRHGVGEALLHTGYALYDQGDVAGAQGAYEQALTEFSQVDDKLDMASALNEIANTSSMRADHTGAVKRYEQAAAISREIGSKDGQATALGNLATDLEIEGNLTEAIGNYRQTLALLREIGREDSQAIYLGDLATALYLRGRLAESEKALNQSLAICRRIDSKGTCGWALSDLGDLLKWEGKPDQAKSRYQEALDIRNKLGDALLAAETSMAVAELSIEEGHAREAEAAVREAREVFRKQAVMDDEIQADAVLAEAVLAEGNILEARKEIDAAMKLAANAQNREMHLKMGLVDASIRAASGKADDQATAFKSLGATLAEATRYGFVPYQLETRLALGEIEMKSGHVTDARAHLIALEKEARAKGFGLVAGKAAAAYQHNATYPAAAGPSLHRLRSVIVRGEFRCSVCRPGRRPVCRSVRCPGWRARLLAAAHGHDSRAYHFEHAVRA
jgi:tetratricopeptide (TPR) repeat protein